MNAQDAWLDIIEAGDVEAYRASIEHVDLDELLGSHMRGSIGHVLCRLAPAEKRLGFFQSTIDAGVLGLDRALCDAAQLGDVALVEWLLTAGAQLAPDVSEGDASAVTIGGLHPLHLAAKSGHLAVVKRFIDAGADVDQIARHVEYTTAIHGRVLLSGAAARAQHTAVDQAVSGSAERRAHNLAAELAAQLTPVLRAAARGGDQGAEILRSLAPRPGDAALAFTPEIAQAIQEASDAAWASDDPPRIRVEPDQTEVDVSIAPVGALAEGLPLADPFPGAYRALARYMTPGRVWVTWVHRAPDEPRGVRYDGLVWLDDHWAWFPKPWRAAEEALSR